MDAFWKKIEEDDDAAPQKKPRVDVETVADATNDTPLKEEDGEAAPPAAPNDNLEAYLERVLEVLAREDDCKELEDILGASLDAAQPSGLGSASAAEVDDAADEELKLFQEVLTSGKMPSRTPVDNRFRRAHPPGSEGHDEYMALTSASDKAAFRMRWAAAQHEEIKRKKHHSKSLTQSVKTKGKLVTFGGLVQHYGGWSWKPAVQGARLTAGKCANFGGKWCKRGAFSNLLLFRVLEEEDEEEFKKTWSEAVESYSQSRSVIVQDLLASSTAPSPSPPPPTSKAKAKAKAKSPAKVPAKCSAGSNGNGNVDEHGGGKLSTLMRDATKVKALYERSVSTATALRTQIKADETWAWARGSEIKELDELLLKVEGHITHVTREFLFQDAAVMKKKYTEVRLIDEVTRLVNAKMDILALGAKRDEMMRMQRARAR